MPEVTITQTGRKIRCAEGDNLLKVLQDAGEYVDNPCAGNGTCGKCKVLIPHYGQEKNDNVKELGCGLYLACTVAVTKDMEVNVPGQKKEHRISSWGYTPEFERDRWDLGYGIAVDLGTTTIAAVLVDLKTGKTSAEASAVNGQRRYGLDVLTRITYETDHPEEGIKILQQAVVFSLNDVISQLCQETGIDREKIKEIAVAANCTMMHMLLGVDARSIGRSPYQPVFLEDRECSAREIGLLAGEETVLYCLPHVSSYVGADIAAGAYVCGLSGENKVLFIDIGTNGEIVLSGNGRMICCSCAAGPALEGMNISCGMGAAKGAAEKISIKEQKITIETIGGGLPEGICGSGILSAVKELLGCGIIKNSGTIIKREQMKDSDYRKDLLTDREGKRAVMLHEKAGLFVTQDDIRQVQLAKGAILSGIQALLHNAGITAEELEKVVIAGQFGQYLPSESLIGIGMLPKETEGKIEYIGNSSKTGAYMSLLSGKAKTEIKNLADRMEYIELAKAEGYGKIFAGCMRFPNHI